MKDGPVNLNNKHSKTRHAPHRACVDEDQAIHASID